MKSKGKSGVEKLEKSIKKFGDFDGSKARKLKELKAKK
jgi:hypothetical protein